MVQLNNDDDSNLSEEQKKSCRPWLPNDLHFQDKDNTDTDTDLSESESKSIQDKVNANLVIFTHLDCSTCGNKDTKQYDAPGIPYNEYVYDELKLICSCGNKYNCKPIFGVSTDWKGFFDNGNGHDSKSKFNTKTNENGDDDGSDGRGDENGNSRILRANPQKLNS